MFAGFSKMVVHFISPGGGVEVGVLVGVDVGVLVGVEVGV